MLNFTGMSTNLAMGALSTMMEFLLMFSLAEPWLSLPRRISFTRERMTTRSSTPCAEQIWVMSFLWFTTDGDIHDVHFLPQSARTSVSLHWQDLGLGIMWFTLEILWESNYFFFSSAILASKFCYQFGRLWSMTLVRSMIGMEFPTIGILQTKLMTRFSSMTRVAQNTSLRSSSETLATPDSTMCTLAVILI